jgi:tRNA threonylcarbamoyladenosine biosynthesis protein TsaB
MGRILRLLADPRHGLKYGMPIILAIETSSELASCALFNSGATPSAVFSRETAGVRTHSQSVLPMVQELLREAGVKLADCDAIAFGAGPGSFTGVRTACGVAQGLAFGAGLPVLPMVTLETLAEACRARSSATEVLAVLDARMGEVYWAQYRFDAARELALLGAPALAAGLAVPAAQAQPLYLRNKVAYTSAERQAINAAKAGA